MFESNNDNKKKKKKKTTVPHHGVWRLVSDVKLYRILESYKVGQAEVTITTDGNYIVGEPALNEQAASAYGTIFEHMGRTAHGIADYQNISESQIISSFQASSDVLDLSEVLKKNYSAMMYYLIRDILGFRIIDVLINDGDIEDITCENDSVPVGVLHRRYPEFFVMDTNIRFERRRRGRSGNTGNNPATTTTPPPSLQNPEPANSLETFTKTLMQLTGRYSTSVSPYVEGSTVRRDRLSAFGGHHITPDGPSFTIRRFPEKPITVIDLIRNSLMPVEAAAYIWSIFEGNGTGMIVGNTGSGKTTILNAVLALVNKRWKIILIEDTEEVRVPQTHCLRLKTRMSTDSFNRDYQIGIGDLLSYSLRQRPQFVVVGEVRLADVPLLFQVYETGHASLSTFHASSPEKALTRLEAKPIEIMAAQKDDLWFLLHVGRVLEDGVFCRKMLALTETHLRDDGKIELIPIITYNPSEKRFDGARIADIVLRSRRLGYAASINGISDTRKDMDEKVRCLSGINGDATHRDILDAIYRQPAP